MDWTWHLDGVVPTLLMAGTLLGGLAVGVSCLAGGLSLVRRPAARAALTLALAASIGLALTGYEDSAAQAAILIVLAGIGAGAIVAVRAVRRRVVSPVLRTAAAAFLVLVWDATPYPMSGGSTMLILLAACTAGLLAAALRAVQRQGARARALLSVAAVWVVATVGLACWSRLNLKLAEDRAPIVIAACRRFEGDRGRLPSSLDHLIPRYLPQIPSANWTLFGGFLYEPDRGELSYLYPWPFARVYSFASDEWDSQRIQGYQADRESSSDATEPGDA